MFLTNSELGPAPASCQSSLVHNGASTNALPLGPQLARRRPHHGCRRGLRRPSLRLAARVRCLVLLTHLAALPLGCELPAVQLKLSVVGAAARQSSGGLCFPTVEVCLHVVAHRMMRRPHWLRPSHGLRRPRGSRRPHALRRLHYTRRCHGVRRCTGMRRYDGMPPSRGAWFALPCAHHMADSPDCRYTQDNMDGRPCDVHTARGAPRGNANHSPRLGRIP